MLTACSRVPTKQPYLVTESEMVLPTVQKPLEDMQPIDPPPAPDDISKLPADQQAQAALRLYNGMADYAGKCMKTRQSLIDWIDRWGK